MVKRRIFRPAEPGIGKRAAEPDDQNQEREELRMPDRPAGKVEPAHLKPRQAVDDVHLFAGVELVDAERDDLGAFRNAGADEGPVGVVAG